MCALQICCTLVIIIIINCSSRQQYMYLILSTARTCTLIFRDLDTDQLHVHVQHTLHQLLIEGPLNFSSQLTTPDSDCSMYVVHSLPACHKTFNRTLFQICSMYTLNPPPPSTLFSYETYMYSLQNLDIV